MSRSSIIPFEELPGGRDLLSWFGRSPSFHDAEIINFIMRRRAPSEIHIHTWNGTNTIDERGYFGMDKHAVVIFTLEDIIDMQVEGFNVQNVIYGLRLRRAPDRPERRPYFSLDPSPDDIELELEHCFGLSGILRCRKMSIRVVPGLPDDYLRTAN